MKHLLERIAAGLILAALAALAWALIRLVEWHFNKLPMRPFIILFLILPFISRSQAITRIESVQSLYLEVYRDNLRLGSGTGFIIRSKTQNYLITNYHVVTGRNPTNNQWLPNSSQITPNRIAILHNGPQLGTYLVKWESLMDGNWTPQWHQDSINNEIVDVIELPLKDTTGISIFPVNYNQKADELTSSIVLQPTDRIYILGFPLGVRSAPALPVWKSGLIASEPDIDQEGKPIMWIDAVTFPGMSGSPVYFIASEFNTKDKGWIQSFGQVSIFVGVFSHAHGSNIYGSLWKASFLKKIFDALP